MTNVPILQNFINRTMAYFDTEDLPEETQGYEDMNSFPTAAEYQPPRRQEERLATMSTNSKTVERTTYKDHMDRPMTSQSVNETTVIDIKFPKKYEDACDIVNLLLQDASVLIDFQHMTDSQARRCIDYLDGARFVLNGNLKKISSTMWLLTPVNVVVNIEDMNLRGDSQENIYDFDMKRR